MLIFLMLITTTSIPTALCKCYSCAGNCFSEPCNCQMGSCESEYCFIERKPTDVRGRYRITKGCIKRPSRTQFGCDYDRFRDHILCICRGDFCNDLIYFRPIHRRNVTCRNCSEREPECEQSCQGQWCHEDSTTGASGCGYGPPSLPYFYKGPELFEQRSRLCVTISRGAGKPRKHCICNSNNCNTAHRSHPWYGSDGFSKTRSILTSALPQLQICVNCEMSVLDSSVTASCKQNTCTGHFCTYATQRVHITNHRGQSAPILTERQGCVNVSDSKQIQLGCTHKWMDNEEEELFCACNGMKCNRDLATASINRASSDFNTLCRRALYLCISFIYLNYFLHTEFSFHLL